MKKRLSPIAAVVVLLLVLATTAFAASTETFYGGYSDSYTKGNIVVDLTNISSMENVILSETEVAEYFDDIDTLNMVIDYDFEEYKEITVKDILAYYNDNGGVPIYYADAGPVVVTAKSAMRTFYFSYKGDIPTVYEPKFYSFFEYVFNFNDKQIYIEPPEDERLLAAGTFATLSEPGKYIFVVRDDGLVFPSFAGIFCVHIGNTPSETPIPKEPENQAPKDLNNINVNPTTSKVLVNGKVVEFEAYNINGYNYFKLRDIAQAVNNTEKKF